MSGQLPGYDTWLSREPEETEMDEFPITTLCGSMRYFDKMLEVAEKMTAAGEIILMPYVLKGKERPGGTSPEFTRKLDEIHLRKIDMADRVIVVGMRIGESTQVEIDYAVKHDIPVFYWTEHFGPVQ